MTYYQEPAAIILQRLPVAVGGREVVSHVVIAEELQEVSHSSPVNMGA